MIPPLIECSHKSFPGAFATTEAGLTSSASTQFLLSFGLPLAFVLFIVFIPEWLERRQAKKAKRANTSGTLDIVCPHCWHHHLTLPMFPIVKGGYRDYHAAFMVCDECGGRFTCEEEVFIHYTTAKYHR